MINLNVHSCYEFLSSTIRFESLIDTLLEDNQEAVAITDFNTLHGIYEFLDIARKKQIKAIPGMEVELENAGRLVLLAKNEHGFQALSKLSLAISQQSNPTIDINMLNDYVSECILIAKSEHVVHELKSTSVSNDIYQAHTIETDTYPKVYINAAYYLDPSHAAGVSVLHAIRDKTKLSPNQLQRDGDHHVKRFAELTPDEAQFLKNNESIALQCQVELTPVKHTLPKFNGDDNTPSKEILWAMLEDSFSHKVKDSQAYRDRLDHEFKIICEMGYEDYFLIVQDVVNFAKNKGIIVGPGRGSSSASLVSFLLNITEIDPLKYDLLFERFLNPKRVSMPDIDIDFEDTKRDTVITYLMDRYGSEHVASIITFNTLTLKALLKDVGRVFLFSDEETKRLSDIITDNEVTTVYDLILTHDYQQFKETDHKFSVIEPLLSELEQLPKHTGIHAAGIILSDKPLIHTVPVKSTTLNEPTVLISQWPANQVEAMGLLKIDILALRTLSLLRTLERSVRRIDDSFRLKDIDMDSDPKVYRMLSKGFSMGIFQLETSLMRKNLPVVEPKDFEELVAMISLNRPGPMAEIPRYVKGKNNPNTISPIHQDLDEILSNTYGVITYQEQVMQIASSFGKLSFAQADIMRRAMSKKDQSALVNLKSEFIRGAVSQGYDEQDAIAIYRLIEQFKDYGFPKSHAVNYAKIGYQMAYIKANYPQVFFANLLDYDMGNAEKIHVLLKEMKRFNIHIHRPSVNQSLFYNTAKDGIRLGFHMIRSMNFTAAHALIEERKANGPFKDIVDMKARIESKNLNTNAIQSLIYAGACDDFGVTRKEMLQTLPKLSSVTKDEYSHHGFLTELGFQVKASHVEVDEMPAIDMLDNEKKVLGFYVSPHPLTAIKHQYAYVTFDTFTTVNNGTYAVFIEKITKIKTKKNQDMAFLLVTDGETHIEAIVFPSTYDDIFYLLKSTYVVIRGNINTKDGNEQLIVNAMFSMNEYVEHACKQARVVYVRNVSQYNTLDEFRDNGVEVINFDTKETMGRIPHTQLLAFIAQFNVNDVRLMS